MWCVKITQKLYVYVWKSVEILTYPSPLTCSGIWRSPRVKAITINASTRRILLRLIFVGNKIKGITQLITVFKYCSLEERLRWDNQSGSELSCDWLLCSNTGFVIHICSIEISAEAQLSIDASVGSDASRSSWISE